jgi:hypothetical protein
LSTEPDAKSPAPHALPVAASLAPREILSAAWPLFKACLPVCLPLAIVGVAAGATPGAEAAQSAGARSLAYTRDWWALVAASALLTLICYGAVLRQQLALASGGRPQVLDSLRRAALDVPAVLVLIIVLALPLLPAMLATAWRGFDLFAALLTLLAGGLLIFGWFAWPVLVDRGTGPFAALATSIRMVRGQWRGFVFAAAALLAAVLVFVLLVGILVGVVMGLAGQATSAAAGGQAFSRWLMGLILALPVVYGGAVTVSAWRAATVHCVSAPSRQP